MADDEILEEMIEGLELNGEIRITDGIREVYIQSYDEDGSLIYIAGSNKEFDDPDEAIQWAIDQFGGLENIEEWE